MRTLAPSPSPSGRRWPRATRPDEGSPGDASPWEARAREDRIDDALAIAQNVAVPEAQHGPTLAGEIAVATFVAKFSRAENRRLRRSGARRRKGSRRHRVHRNLAAKLEAAEAPVSRGAKGEARPGRRASHLASSGALVCRNAFIGLYARAFDWPVPGPLTTKGANAVGPNPSPFGRRAAQVEDPSTSGRRWREAPDEGPLGRPAPFCAPAAGRHGGGGPSSGRFGRPPSPGGRRRCASLARGEGRPVPNELAFATCGGELPGARAVVGRGVGDVQRNSGS